MALYVKGISRIDLTILGHKLMGCNLWYFLERSTGSSRETNQTSSYQYQRSGVLDVKFDSRQVTKKLSNFFKFRDTKNRNT